jgi:drug/metabolite transporter (DMT)-like permease
LLGSVPADIYLLMFGVGLTVFALSVAVQYGLTHVPANRAIVIMLFELVIAALGAYLLAGEAMTTREWIGGVMIISASLFSSRMNRA